MSVNDKVSQPSPTDLRKLLGKLQSSLLSSAYGMLCRLHRLSSLLGQLPPRQIWHQIKLASVKTKRSGNFLLLIMAVRHSDTKEGLRKSRVWRKGRKKRKTKRKEWKRTWQAEWEHEVERTWNNWESHSH